MSHNVTPSVETAIWLVGAGPMAHEYINVLQGLHSEFVVIGRGDKSACACEKATGEQVIRGGLDDYLLKKPKVCAHAIVAVGVEKLFDETKKLIEYGVSNILVEKPAAIEQEQIEKLVSLCNATGAKVYVAYNRRFFASVLKAKDMIEADGGVTSFNFEFTEWSHVIAPLVKGVGVKEKWFLANSTHVVDLAFYLGGKPKEISCFTAGNIEWHSAASNFAGAGITYDGALFNYGANWESAGRWSIEILTEKGKYIFRPMEALSFQEKGSIKVIELDLGENTDEVYKPGLYKQVQAFVSGDVMSLCTIQEQKEMFSVYATMASY